MELEEAIQFIKDLIKELEKHKERCEKSNDIYIDTEFDNKYIMIFTTVLNHITKQEKMIELMARFIDTELSSEHLSKVLQIDVKPLETYREDIKQYFEKKAEENK